MDPRNLEKQREPEEPRFLSFPHLPEGSKKEDGTRALNRWSSTLTTGHNFPGAQVHTSAHVGMQRDEIDRRHRRCCTRPASPPRKP